MTLNKFLGLKANKTIYKIHLSIRLETTPKKRCRKKFQVWDVQCYKSFLWQALASRVSAPASMDRVQSGSWAINTIDILESPKRTDSPSRSNGFQNTSTGLCHTSTSKFDTLWTESSVTLTVSWFDVFFVHRLDSPYKTDGEEESNGQLLVPYEKHIRTNIALSCIRVRCYVRLYSRASEVTHKLSSDRAWSFNRI